VSAGEVVVLLAGGTGGAKLARGMPTSSTPSGSAAIVNTGDDIEIYGAHVSPDPDLVSFWLADAIDERGWGLRGDTFAVMDALRELGVGHVVQPRRPRPRVVPASARGCSPRACSPTAALARLNEAIGVRARVLPMSDDPVRTWVRTPRRLASLPGVHDPRARRGPVEGLEFRGAEQATPERAGARGDRARPRDRDRPVQPARLDRPDPRRPGHPRGARRRARPWSPSARSSAARC
jgi:LPPG:FO 2-phospho-L-lactate transferase